MVLRLLRFVLVALTTKYVGGRSELEVGGGEPRVLLAYGPSPQAGLVASGGSSCSPIKPSSAILVTLGAGLPEAGSRKQMLLVSLDAHGRPGSGATAEGNAGYRALAAGVGGIGVEVS